MPIPGNRVIPREWSQHHRPVAEGGMTSTCDILERGERTGLADDAGKIIAHGVHCRVQQLNGNSGGAVFAGQEVQEHRYLVALPTNVDIYFKAGSSGHQIIVTDGNDPEIVGRRLDVVQVLFGNEVWQRDLLCVDNLTQNRGF